MTEKTILSTAEKSLIQLIMTTDCSNGEKELAKLLAIRSPTGKFKYAAEHKGENPCAIFTYSKVVQNVEYKFEFSFMQWGTRYDEVQGWLMSAKGTDVKKYKYDRHGFYSNDNDFTPIINGMSRMENDLPKLIAYRDQAEADAEKWRQDWRERKENRKEATYQDVLQHYGRNKPKNFDELYQILKGFGNAKKIIDAMDKMQPLMR
jgi:hypothetical protein